MVVRIRPPVRKDEKFGEGSEALQYDAEKNLLFLLAKEDEKEKTADPKQFVFDKVLWKDSVQYDAWEAAGGADCEVVWNATAATEGGGGACTGCAWTLAVSASVDASRSTCPPDLYAGAENYAADYGIAELGGGSIDLHFTGSGNRFAGGTIEGAVLEYLSDATCNWY